MTGATSETEARNWLGRIVAYNIADAWIAGPLPQVKLWQTDPQPIPDLSAEQWALLANPLLGVAMNATSPSTSM